MKKVVFFILTLVGLSLTFSSYSADSDQQRDRLMDRLEDRDDDYESDRDRDRDREQSQEQDKDGDKDQLRDRTQVYGWQLMTAEEQIQHRNKMRIMTSPQEREQYLKQHHKRMQERAEEAGVSLPEFQSQRVPGGKGRNQTP